ncbi:MAG: hypothetical protein IKO47_05630 [Ruminococcus sp.]|nr:hypothetical protein [Ruminococcus sp.]
MAIRKDLDDMLNSLKKGGSKPDKVKKKGAEKVAPQRKSIYDSMSVDDLLTALNDDKKGNEIAEIAEEITVAEKPVTFSEEINVIRSSGPDVNKASAEAPAPPKKKKRIVITGELPDYEAIRQRELEKDRLAREAAEKAEREEQERLAREAAEKAEREEQERLAREAAEKAEREEQERLAREAAEKAEREEQERLAREAAERAEREEQERLAREAADKAEREEQERLAREAAERAELAEQELPDDNEIEAAEDEPSAEELLDAALAAIRNTALAEEIEENTVPADETKDAAPLYGEDEDPVSSMIEGMREDAANAIADLDKPAEEEKPAEPEDAPAEAEEAQKPLKEVKEEKKQNVLERILDEDPDELLNERSEHSEEDGEETAPKNRTFKRRLYAVLGAVFAVFAVIGMVFVGAKCVKAIRDFTSGEVRKDGFTEVLYPVVIMDIDQFSDPSELSSEQMLTASIWSIIMDNDRVTKYSVDPGTDTISIPYMDVEARAVEMFGTDHPEFEHCTVGPVDSRFFYSDGAYNVKPKTITFTYSPEIKSIVKSGSSYTVSVDYVDELPEWMEKSVSKSVEFRLTEHDDGTYTINSMKINYVKSNGL